eukprot:8828525-Ditylum_brightwellii.AAC.1
MSYGLQKGMQRSHLKSKSRLTKVQYLQCTSRGKELQVKRCQLLTACLHQSRAGNSSQIKPGMAKIRCSNSRSLECQIQTMPSVPSPGGVLAALPVTEAEMVAGVQCVQDKLYIKCVLECMGLQVELIMVLHMDNSGSVDL